MEGCEFEMANGSFVKSMSALVTGSLAAQILSIVVSPITTRLFTPTELGVFTLVASSTSMFGAVLSLRYDMAVVYEDSEENVYALIALSFVICLISSLLVAVGYFLYFQYFSLSDFSAPIAAMFTFAQCVLFGSINILNSYNNRCKEYGVMSASNVARSFAQNSGTILSGLAHLGSFGLLAAQTLGYLFGLKRQSKTLLGQLSRINKLNRAQLKTVAIKHRGQAIWSSPAAFANGFSYTVINYIVEFLYGSSAVGLYSLSFRMLGMPTNVIAMNVSRVFAERAASEKRESGSFTKLFRRTLFLMCLAAIPVLVALVLLSPALFALVFGDEWRDAGIYVQILSPMFALRFIAAGLNSSAMIAGKQQRDLLIQLMLIVAVFVSFCITTVFKLPIESLLIVINAISSIIYVIYLKIFWECSKCR